METKKVSPSKRDLDMWLSKQDRREIKTETQRHMDWKAAGE